MISHFSSISTSCMNHIYKYIYKYLQLCKHLYIYKNILGKIQLNINLFISHILLKYMCVCKYMYIYKLKYSWRDSDECEREVCIISYVYRYIYVNTYTYISFKYSWRESARCIPDIYVSYEYIYAYVFIFMHIWIHFHIQYLNIPWRDSAQCNPDVFVIWCIYTYVYVCENIFFL